ncbi:MAG: AAA family ATPase [Candidatus Falkowbacteria bacterium]|nr:AAA family ATPase [Candidatus Falkowbacteria bacterium]
MIHAEYQRFLQTLDNETDSDGVRKIANLVLEHLDDLLPLTNQQGQRVIKMVALAQVNWQAIKATIQPIHFEAIQAPDQISQLKNMLVGPFRGFARQEVFNLSSRLVLIYGPNGSGKSSFCEALEYGLLGNVADADNKRFRDQKDYLKNAHVDRFAAPIITFENKQGDEIQLEANETAYRFCFVEKNRIDSFSRIAAQTPAKQTELISTLFGMETFVEFVRNFTSEINPKYIDLSGKKAALLDQKRQGLIGAHQLIKTNNLELPIIDTDEQNLTNQYRAGLTFNEMVYELNGDEQRPGVIQNLELELQQPIATKSNLTSVALKDLRSSINPNITELTENRQKLTDDSQLVSFKRLYDAVSKLQLSSTDKCPACLTPLNQVVVDPYSHANKELQKLEYLAELQKIYSNRSNLRKMKLV